MARYADADDAVTAFDSDKKPRGKWRWLTIILGCIFGLGLLTAIYNYDPLDLEVNRIGWLRADDGHAVEILNVGSGPTTVQQVQVNGRGDCMVARSMMAGDQFRPVNLKVGEKLNLISTCRIVRATIRTNNGSNTYNFGGG
jgi:hypothetical protein